MTGRVVPGRGPTSARIALVGEAPGEDEERLGEPFVGASGRLLNEMLAAAGIDRRGCYVTNVVKTRPPGNDFRQAWYEDKRGLVPKPELVAAREALVKELQAIEPNVIVALGDEALRALTGHGGLGKWRGSIIATPAGKVVATYHPARILREWSDRRIAEVDLRRAKTESLTSEVNIPVIECLINPTKEQVLDWLGRVQPGTTLAFDIETLGATVRCIGFAVGPRSAMCVPFVSCRRGRSSGGTGTLVPTDGAPFGSHWAPKDEEDILREVTRVLEDPRVPLIAQNFQFDAARLSDEFGIVCQGLVLDTMVAQHCCYCELPKSLAFMCSLYTRVPFYKDHDASSDLDEWRYNCYDAAVTYEIAGELVKEMKEMGV